MCGDVISVESDVQSGEALLRPVMRGGRRIEPPTAMTALREQASEALRRLPEPLRRLEPGAGYPVEIAPALRSLAEEVDRRLGRGAAS